jgi:hypothetical protein
MNHVKKSYDFSEPTVLKLKPEHPGKSVLDETDSNGAWEFFVVFRKYSESGQKYGAYNCNGTPSAF